MVFFCHNPGIKYLVFPGFDIQLIDVLNVYFSVEEALLAGYFYNFEEFWYLKGKKEICNKMCEKWWIKKNIVVK